MKQAAFLILCICLCGSALAQPPRRDTTRGGGGARDPWRDRTLRADVLEGRSTMTHIVPRQRICFDKVVKIKQVTSRGPSEACIFINTQTGLVGHSPIKRGSAGLCDIKPEEEHFSLFVMGLSGNTYHYFNQKKKNTIGHHVMTMNSQQSVYQFASGSTNAMLKRKTESRTYCDDKARAMAYRVDGRSETWFLFGKTFPDEVLMSPQKFLGNYGVGYVFSDKGLFIIMQLESGALDSKILEIRDESICFDGSGFKVFEEEFVTKAQSSIQRKREKTERELAGVGSEQCDQLKRESLQFELEMLDRQEQNVRASQQGHTAQSPRTQQALGDAVMNYDDALQAMINDTRYKICRAEYQLSRQSGNQSSSRERAQQKLSCMRDALARQISMQEQFQTINRQANAQTGRQSNGQPPPNKALMLMQVAPACN